MTVRIVIADDHEIVRQGVRRIVDAHDDWEVCGEAANGEKAVELTKQLRPDAVIMDVSMPVKGGLDATREIVIANASIPVLVFTMHESATMAESARKMGARGIVMKSDAVRDLVNALEQVLSGGTFFPSGERRTAV